MIPTFRTDLACINLNFSLKTEKDARAYAGNQGGAFLPLTSLQNLRKDKIPDETTVTVGIRKDEILQNESKFLNLDSDRTTILKGVANGYPVREMAAKIGKSIGTIQTHLRELENDGLIGNESGKM